MTDLWVSRKVLGELKKYGFKGKLTPCEIRYKVEN